MVIHRQWISPHMRLFKGGMYDFMQDHQGLQAIFRVERAIQQRLGCPKLPVDFVRQLMERSQPRFPMDVHYAADQALSATLLALRHLLSLEDVHEKALVGASTHALRRWRRAFQPSREMWCRSDDERWLSPAVRQEARIQAAAASRCRWDVEIAFGIACEERFEVPPSSLMASFPDLDLGESHR